MRTYVGKCVECGASMYYNEDEEKLQVVGQMPGCLCHFDWPEDREEEKEGEGKSECCNADLYFNHATGDYCCSICTDPVRKKKEEEDGNKN